MNAGPPKHQRRELRLRRFERRTVLPMLVLSVVFLVLVVLPFVLDLSPEVSRTLDRAALVIWVVFAVEFAIRLLIAPDKLRFIARNPLDLVSVALPLLRPLRVVRTLGLLKMLGVARAETSLLRLIRRGRAAFGRHRIVYSILVIGLVTLGATIVTHQAEQNADGATLTTFGATFWWAVQVVTTVGSAEAFPVTLSGRVAAVVLMVVGVGLFGLVAASLASTYIFRGDEGGSQSRTRARSDLRTVAERLDRIELELRALRQEGAGTGLDEASGDKPDEPSGGEPPAPGGRRRAA